MIELVGVDADDTLWDEASAFERAETCFVDTITGWTGDTEVRTNLRALHFDLIRQVGYGASGYRTALHRFCETRLPPKFRDAASALADTVCDDLDLMIIAPLPGVERALRQLTSRFRLLLISKGDDQRQRHKLAASGLGWAFSDVLIVPEKTVSVYRGAFGRARAAMIGNSLKSDILPALESGAFGLYVPFHSTSPLEHAERPAAHCRFHEFVSLQAAADWLCRADA